MASLKSIVKERKKYLKELLSASRDLDIKQEAFERYIKRIATRTRSVPDESDLAKAIALYRLTLDEVKRVTELLEQGYVQ